MLIPKQSIIYIVISNGKFHNFFGIYLRMCCLCGHNELEANFGTLYQICYAR